MNTYYKNNLKQAFLVLEAEETQELTGDYQIQMLEENAIPGILKMKVRYVDGTCQYHYEISGKNSFRMRHEKKNLTYQDIRKVTVGILHALKELQKYMITEDKILLDPEYIFCDKDEYFFCYYPPCGEEVKASFHSLTEFFVREVDYKDEEGVKLAYMLHKATMEEHYSVEKILEDCEKEEEGNVTLDYTERMEQINYDEIMVSEKTDMWEPARRFLEKRKKTCQ